MPYVRAARPSVASPHAQQVCERAAPTNRLPTTTVNLAMRTRQPRTYGPDHWQRPKGSRCSRSSHSNHAPNPVLLTPGATRPIWSGIGGPPIRGWSPKPAPSPSPRTWPRSTPSRPPRPISQPSRGESRHRRPEMELRHLRYFIAVAEERSVTRAAERLWLAQPGLSRQIRDLERELGAQLFERHARGVELTDVGERFLERARTAVAAVDSAGATVRDAEAGVVGTVRLGIVRGASWHLTGSVLDEFARARPRVELTLLEGYGGTLWHELREGRIDALISPSGMEVSDVRTLRTLELGSEPWVVLAGQRHRLAATSSLHASDLEGEQIAVTAHRDGSAYDRAVAGLLEELGVTAVLTRTAPGPSLQAAVAREEAVALPTAPAELHPHVIAQPLRPSRALRFELAWRDDATSPALAEFVRLPAESVEASARTRPPLAAVA